MPEYRGLVEAYAVWCLVTLMLLAMLSDATRGQKDLGIRPDPEGSFPAPS